jgi:hypothetical protein
MHRPETKVESEVKIVILYHKFLCIFTYYLSFGKA